MWRKQCRSDPRVKHPADAVDRAGDEVANLKTAKALGLTSHDAPRDRQRGDRIARPFLLLARHVACRMQQFGRDQVDLLQNPGVFTARPDLSIAEPVVFSTVPSGGAID